MIYACVFIMPFTLQSKNIKNDIRLLIGVVMEQLLSFINTLIIEEKIRVKSALKYFEKREVLLNVIVHSAYLMRSRVLLLERTHGMHMA